ncbi:autophagy associated ubiquitin-like protein modifier Atg12 [Schizosaccharomyces pombe]|uniref:Ubiquitin-like protein ATG12 n=1 Tax=Schizosaccharomyces pombe (strain 972 / ATCC 24843) TaxID=284812 RepID=ATG12_SCHPO|nr:autophagy-associated ubiquitin-like modifier Atg12 [Schizosaccharomyces pombe]Q9US24.1 RecName: Full=Ubiquitin-like protein ATG12; AltName: Full=Autophagy-related protein 12 [Schizosaccharomyces pombe 972h-]CAB66169.1 autophagy associated ubiquitin-like modifier Atg12 [Schizosaccharomyces pombe]|eukprot:NP_593661.1 autophagy-associated ubiquitin-like modifier Atg12 [Schizosaccharomyces pombe]
MTGLVDQQELEKRLATEEDSQNEDIENQLPSIETIINTYREKENRRVNLRFKAIGRTPLLRKTVFSINASQRFEKVTRFLKKELGLPMNSSLVLYVNSSFAPSPDEIVGNLYDNFAIDSHLLINYCINVAFG